MTWEKIEHPLQCWPYTFVLPQLQLSLQLSVLKLVEMSVIPWHWGEGCAEISFVLSKVRSRLVPRWEKKFLRMARMLNKMPHMKFLKKWHQWSVQTFSRYFVLNIWLSRLGKIWNSSTYSNEDTAQCKSTFYTTKMAVLKTSSTLLV